MFNEEGSILSLISCINAALKSIEHELILVDDGSTDKTVDVAQTSLLNNHKLIVLDCNYGQSVAIKVGLDHAKYNTISILDADGQNHPDDILSMLKILVETNADLVQGIRSRRYDSARKQLPSRLANSLMRKILNVDILDSGCSLKVFHKSILTDFPFFNGYHRLFSVIAQKRGVRVVQTNVKHQHRISGKSKYGLERIPIFLKHLWKIRMNPTSLNQGLSYSIKEIIVKNR